MSYMTASFLKASTVSIIEDILNGTETDTHILGAILDEVPKGDDPLKFAGSAIVCVAGSKEEVIEKLKKDVYAESNVWDFSKVWNLVTRLNVPSMVLLEVYHETMLI